MRLSSLIVTANNTYGLGLDEKDRAEVHRRLVSAGVEQTVTSRDTSDTLDAVLQAADNLNTRQVTAAVQYREMKQESVAEVSGCPRCGQQMRQVKLARARVANYCTGCVVTLPEKV